MEERSQCRPKMAGVTVQTGEADTAARAGYLRDIRVGNPVGFHGGWFWRWQVGSRERLRMRAWVQTLPAERRREPLAPRNPSWMGSEGHFRVGVSQAAVTLLH